MCFTRTLHPRYRWRAVGGQLPEERNHPIMQLPFQESQDNCDTEFHSFRGPLLVYCFDVRILLPSLFTISCLSVCANEMTGWFHCMSIHGGLTSWQDFLLVENYAVYCYLASQDAEKTEVFMEFINQIHCRTEEKMKYIEKARWWQQTSR